MSAETWRVIDEDGAEHATIVETSEGKLVAVTIRRRCGYPCDTRVRAAIAREAWAADIAVAEILAPGQPSREEVEADAFRRGADAMREWAAKACEIRAEKHKVDGRRSPNGWVAEWQLLAGDQIMAACEIRALPLPEVAK